MLRLMRQGQVRRLLRCWKAAHHFTCNVSAQLPKTARQTGHRTRGFSRLQSHAQVQHVTSDKTSSEISPPTTAGGKRVHSLALRG